VSEWARLGLAGFPKNPAAVVAFHEYLPPLDRDQGNKKKAQVMIQAFEPNRGEATIGASPRLVIYLNFPGLHTADENEGPPPLRTAGQRLAVIFSNSG